MKEYKQLGAYGLVIKDESILLIKKFGGNSNGFKGSSKRNLAE